MDYFFFLWKLNARGGIRHRTLNSEQEILIYGIKPSQALNTYLTDAYKLATGISKVSRQLKNPSVPQSVEECPMDLGIGLVT